MNEAPDAPYQFHPDRSQCRECFIPSLSFGENLRIAQMKIFFEISPRLERKFLSLS
jgi:hypothetical protein